MSHSLQRCLITGASRGIGRAIARRLAAEDRYLILHGRNQAALDSLVDELAGRGCSSTVVTGDLLQSDAIDTILNSLGDTPLDLLINNAGVASATPFDELSLEEWERTFRINVTVPFLLIKNLTSRMPAGSSIVNILSGAAKTAFPKWGCYVATKFALDGFTRSVREDLRPRRIRMINIYPGSTNTDIWDQVPGDYDRSTMMPPEQVADAVAFAIERADNVLIEDLSLGRLGGAL